MTKPIELRWPPATIRLLVGGGLAVYTIVLVVPIDRYDQRWAAFLVAALMLGSAALGALAAGERFRVDDEGLARIVFGQRRAFVRWGEIVAIKRSYNDQYAQLSFRSATAKVNLHAMLDNFIFVAAFALAHVDPTVIDAGKNVRRTLEMMQASTVVRR